jgi:hypothetical protein
MVANYLIAFYRAFPLESDSSMMLGDTILRNLHDRKHRMHTDKLRRKGRLSMEVDRQKPFAVAPGPAETWVHWQM